MRVPGTAAELNEKLLADGILGGYELGREHESLASFMVIAATEMNSKAGIDRFVDIAKN